LFDRDYTDLGALTAQQYADVGDKLRSWVRGFIAANSTHTLSLLRYVATSRLLAVRQAA